MTQSLAVETRSMPRFLARETPDSSILTTLADAGALAATTLSVRSVEPLSTMITSNLPAG